MFIINIWMLNLYAMPPEYEVRTRTNTMAKYLMRSGHKVKIISASTIHNTNINLMENENGALLEKKYGNLEFVHVKTSNYKGNGLSRIINHFQFAFRLLLNFKKITMVPDVVICNLGVPFVIFPYVLSKKIKAKFIFEVRDLWPESFVVFNIIKENNPILKLLYICEKWIYKKADKIIFTMEGGKDYIIEQGWNKENGGPIDLKKVYHINNGVDLEAFDYNKENFALEDVDLNNMKTFKVLYTGSMGRANSLNYLIQAAQLIQDKGYNDIRFIFFGDGDQKKYLQQYVNDKIIRNIIFKGRVEKKYISNILSKSELNIFTGEKSDLYRYGLSLNKMFDYLASGKPIVSNVECGYDILEKYNCGITAKGGSAETLAAAILKIYNMPKEEYNNYCNNSLKAAQNFNFKLLTKKLEEVFLEE